MLLFPKWVVFTRHCLDYPGEGDRSSPLNELQLHSNTFTKKWVSNDQLGAHSTVGSGRKYLTMVVGYTSLELILYGIQIKRKQSLISFDMPRQSSNNYHLQVTILASDDHRGHASFPVHLRSPARNLSTPASHTVHCSSQQASSCWDAQPLSRQQPSFPCTCTVKSLLSTQPGLVSPENVSDALMSNKMFIRMALPCKSHLSILVFILMTITFLRSWQATGRLA